MAYALPPLQWLRAFEAAARSSSFSAAAEELNLTPAAVSHQVRSLEQHLRFQLFKRLPRGLQLTDVGRAYLPSVARTFDELTVSTVGLFGRSQHTHVSVRASLLFATTWVAPLLPKFYALFPHIKIRLLAAVWADTSTSVDVDIRFGDGHWSEFEVRPLWREPSVLVARKDDAIAGGSERDKLLSLLKGGVVQIMGCEDRWTKILRKHDLDEAELRVNTMTDNSLIALELTAAGFGPCIVQHSYTTQYLKGWHLHLPLAEGIMINESHFILTPRSAERTAPESVIFRDWLIAELREAQMAMEHSSYGLGGEGNGERGQSAAVNPHLSHATPSM